MEKLRADQFEVSLGIIVYNQILGTSSDVEGRLLQDNKALQGELLVISQ